MATFGPSNGSTAANDASVGATGWANLTQGLTDDTFYATVDTTASIDDITQYFRVTNFGFGIPAGSTITGLVADIKRKTNTASVPIDNSIKFFKASAPHGSDLSAGAAWSTTEGTVSFGSSSTLSGGTYTAADINNSGFGVGFSCADTSTGGWIASINAVWITVYYTPPGGAPQMCMLGVGM